MKARRAKRRKDFVDALGNHCVDCGVSGDESKLEFDHKNPKKKKHNYNAIQDGSISRIEKELKGVELRCSDCHKQKSKLEWDFLGGRKPAQHGTLHSYRNNGCRCDKCVAAAREYRRSKLEQLKE